MSATLALRRANIVDNRKARAEQAKQRAIQKYEWDLFMARNGLEEVERTSHLIRVRRSDFNRSFNIPPLWRRLCAFIKSRIKGA